jgi:hypothetical protein
LMRCISTQFQQKTRINHPQDFKSTKLTKNATTSLTTIDNVWTNCLDSGLWFDNADLNRWYEAWRKI